GSRLLVAYDAPEDEGGQRVEIVHETLLSAWPRLVRWRQADAAGARLRDQLREAARQREERGRASGLLRRGQAFKELALWLEQHGGSLGAVEGAFVAASQSEAARGRRLRRAVLVSVVIGLLVLVAVLLLMNAQTEKQRLEAQEQRTIADENAA